MDSLHARLDIEVREALHCVSGLLALAGDGPLSDAQTEYLSGCRCSLDRLLRVANDLSELTRPEAAPVTAPFSVADAVSEVADLMDSLAAGKGLRLEVTLDPAIPKCLIGYRGLLEDCLRRLLDNAIHFTDQGTVRISATVTGTEPQRMDAIFEVGDSGPGIPPQVLADLATVADGSCGVALGLQVVKRRLERLGGELTTVSNSANGAILRITLPMQVPTGATDPGNGAHPAGRALNGIRLLVAEDADDSFALFESYTKSAGYSIDRALNGEEAVQMVRGGAYDMVVMDVRMPLMDGYSATRLIREWETEHRSARIPILLLSADDVERQVRIGSSVGCSGFLAKPATRMQVLTALRYYAAPPLERMSRPN